MLQLLSYVEPSEDDRKELDAEADKRVSEIVATLEERAEQNGGRRGLHVFGFFGVRGQGKTTFLRALGRAMGRFAGDTMRFIVPFEKIDPRANDPKLSCERAKHDDERARHDDERTKDSRPVELFKPSNADPKDELVPDLLDYLRALVPEGREIERLDDLWDALTFRINRDQLIRQAIEVEPTEKALRGKLKSIYEEVSKLERKLPEKMAALVKAIADYECSDRERKRSASIVLLIDDIDLAPLLALKLLRFVHTVFSRVHEQDVVVLLAADSELFIEAVGDGLAAEMTRSPAPENWRHLAWPIVEKLVPDRWAIPRWPAEKYFRRLERGPLALLWPRGRRAEDPDQIDLKLRIASVYTNRKRLIVDAKGSKSASAKKGDAPDVDSQRFDYSALEPEVRRFLSDFEELAPLMPTTPRKWLQLNNLLVNKLRQLDVTSNDPPESIQLRLKGRLGAVEGVFDDSSAVRVWVMLKAASVRCRMLEVDPDYVDSRHLANAMTTIQDLARLTVDPDLVDRTTLLSSIEENPVLAIFRNDQYAGAERADADEVLRYLASRWARYSRKLPEDFTIFLLFSYDADAVASTRALLAQTGHLIEADTPDTAPELFRVTHLDLHRPGARSPEQLRAAMRDLAEQVEESGIGNLYDDPIRFAARAPLTLCLWLGWRLNRQRHVTAYNFFAGNYVAFEGPEQPLRKGPGDLRWFLEIEPRRVASDDVRVGEAIVIIDLMGQLDVSVFESFPEALNATTDGFLIQWPAERGSILPDDLQEILEDVDQAVAELRAQGYRTFHLGYRGPDAVAFFIGRELYQKGAFKLYEFSGTHAGSRYEYVFDLDQPDLTTGPSAQFEGLIQDPSE